MKNILVIQGGGRAKGNTAQLIEHFANGVWDSGHTVEVISLLKNEVKSSVFTVSPKKMTSRRWEDTRSIPKRTVRCL